MSATFDLVCGVCMATLTIERPVVEAHIPLAAGNMGWWTDGREALCPEHAARDRHPHESGG